MANTSGLSRREVLRQQQKQEEERAKRNRRILFAALVTVALVVVAADQVGKYREYHASVYENQPSEGAGYTDQQLRVDFAAQAGITGEDLTTFQELYDAKAFQDFVDASDKTFVDEGISGTPTYMVGDTKLEFTNDKNEVVIEPTAEDLLRAINEANN